MLKSIICPMLISVASSIVLTGHEHESLRNFGWCLIGCNGGFLLCMLADYLAKKA